MRRKTSLLTSQVNLQQAFNLKINDLHFADCFEYVFSNLTLSLDVSQVGVGILLQQLIRF